MQQTTEERVEVIMVRLNTIYSEKRIREVFMEVAKSFMASKHPPRIFKLCKSTLVQNDWAIYLRRFAREGEPPPQETERLSATLRSLGLVHHTVWKTCESFEADISGS